MAKIKQSMTSIMCCPMEATNVELVTYAVEVNLNRYNFIVSVLDLTCKMVSLYGTEHKPKFKSFSSTKPKKVGAVVEVYDTDKRQATYFCSRKDWNDKD